MNKNNEISKSSIQNDEKAYDKFYQWINKANKQIEENHGGSNGLTNDYIAKNFLNIIKDPEFQLNLKYQYKKLDENQKVELLNSLRSLMITLP